MNDSGVVGRRSHRAPSEACCRAKRKGIVLKYLRVLGLRITISPVPMAVRTAAAVKLASAEKHMVSPGVFFVITAS